MTTKKNLVKSMFMNILTAGIFATVLASCTSPMDDIAEGLVNGVADKMLDSKGQKEREEKQKQERLENLLNWNIGSEVDQEAIDKFGYDNCFQATEVPASLWDKAGINTNSSDVDINDLRFVRCLIYTYAINGYAPRVGGLICNTRIAGDLVSIFRQLYEAKYVVDQDGTILMVQQQGMAVVVTGEEPLTSNDLAVRLFKERGFTWGGDEPNGNPNYFSK